MKSCELFDLIPTLVGVSFAFFLVSFGVLALVTAYWVWKNGIEIGD